MSSATVRAAAVSLRGVDVQYGDRRSAVQALDAIDLEVHRGEVVAVVGPSGCGKTTMLAVIAGLIHIDSGTASVADDVALMPQRDLLMPWRTALGNAAVGLEAIGVARKAAERSAAPYFTQFGLDQFRDAYPSELSGGMRQRVAFLRTVVTGRPLLVLDEPFAALDSLTRAEMQSWLINALQSEPRTVVLVTHDIEEALVLGSRVLVMSPRPGRIVAELIPDREHWLAGAELDDRTAWVTSDRFSGLKRQALDALGGH